MPLALTLNLVFSSISLPAALFCKALHHIVFYVKKKKIKTVQLPLLTHLTLVGTHFFSLRVLMRLSFVRYDSATAAV